MKTLLLILVHTLFATSAFAAQTEYCNDLQRVDNMPRLNADQFSRFSKDGKKVDRLLVSKDRREMYLMKDEVVLKTYKVAFGLQPRGHKQFEGDNKTPEGIYYIDGKNPQSAYYLSLHVSYPNKSDVEFARSKGKSPGGDIMVHGFPNPSRPDFRNFVQGFHPYNWTAGCIAVTDSEMYEIYNIVDVGTVIEICKSK
ncbi:L,D-transpeptidase family protein [Bdellovibrio sp. 22V]|uniref:L,D-transpeptidase family protein n=1 Tax=Bdellovibrio TaxID=958 RepID=UPI0025429856|nr:L,D-transpeptidase family protein [Bdellovibrio sp. 22V]WII70641.1 L,D-transpeptidase family protein [Bdellovibrio sp. 22V]